MWITRYGLKKKFTLDLSGNTLPTTGEKISEVFQVRGGEVVYVGGRQKKTGVPKKS